MNRYRLPKIHSLIIFVLIVLTCLSCSFGDNSEKKNNISLNEEDFYNGKGVGPIKEIVLDSSVNAMQAGNGEEIFQSKCITCHQISEERRIGPGLKGITIRRRPEWIMNQILNPLEMTKTDSMSKELLSIYLSQMTDMSLTEADARNVLEFFRMRDSE